MESKTNIFESVMRHRHIVVLLTLILVVFGVFSLLRMPRQEFPNFTIRQGLVVGIMPGATSAEVEEQLTKKVESFLFGFSEVKREKTSSFSKENVMIVLVELRDEVHDSDAFWAKLRHGLNELKAQLPSEVVSLTGSNDFGNTSAILLSVQAKGRTYRELRTDMEKIEDELRKIPEVSKLRRFGEVPEQISIYFRDEKLVHYGVRPLTVLAALKTEGGVSYSGDLDDGHLVMPVHLPARYKSEQDIAEQIVYADPTGSIVRLKDVARIVREYAEPDSFIENNGESCLILSLEMQTGNNIVEFGGEVDDALDRVQPQLHPSVIVSKVADMPHVVGASIRSFMVELLIAVAAVILVTMLLLPLRVAAVAAATIPITILITVGIINLFGIQLQTVSLASLIVVLGMVVDNAIVVIDSHVDKLDHGMPPWDAAWKSARELFLPVFSASVAILGAFVPFAFWMRGMEGDFVSSLPPTIATALGISIVLAGFLVPTLSYALIKTGLVGNEDKKGKSKFLVGLQKRYDHWLERALKRPVLTVMIGLLSIALGGMVGSLLPQQLFPKVERNQFAVEIYLPDGRSLDETKSIARTVASTLQKDRRVSGVTSFIGTSSPRFHDTYAPNFPGKNYAQLIVITASNDATLELLDENHARFANRFPNAYVRMKQLEISLTQTPIEVRIWGDDIPALKKTSEKVQTVLKKDTRVVWAGDDFGEPLPGVRLDIRKDEANRLGLTKGIIATSLMVGLKGLPVATLWEGDYPLSVVVKREHAGPDRPADITDQYVSSLILPVSVPVRQVANVVPDWSEGQIARRNGMRALTVRAYIGRESRAADIIAKARPEIGRIPLPAGIRIDYGGEDEAAGKAYSTMSKSLLTSIVLIFFILLFQFKRIRLALLIMCAMPLGILGAMLGLLIVGFPFGFTAFVGVISLFGMVVRNGIILVDYAEALRRKGNMSMMEVTLAAGKRRLRPIFLTSVAAAVGVVPMIISGSSLWGPLGTAICFGLITSMALGLFVLPAGYLLLHKKKHDTEVVQA